MMTRCFDGTPWECVCQRKLKIKLHIGSKWVGFCWLLKSVRKSVLILSKNEKPLSLGVLCFERLHVLIFGSISRFEAQHF